MSDLVAGIRLTEADLLEVTLANGNDMQLDASKVLDGYRQNGIAYDDALLITECYVYNLAQKFPEVVNPSPHTYSNTI